MAARGTNGVGASVGLLVVAAVVVAPTTAAATSKEARTTMGPTAIVAPLPPRTAAALDGVFVVAVQALGWRRAWRAGCARKRTVEPHTLRIVRTGANW